MNVHARDSVTSSARPGVTNHMMETLRQGGIAASFIVRLVRESDIARIAAAAGFDSFYVDLEHSSISIGECSQICAVALDMNVTPLVRVPRAEEIGRVLDGGALGVIAPHIETVEEARRIVAACKFPPMGTRSYSTRLPHFGYRSVDAALGQAELNQATSIVIQIESGRAVENADALAAVSGVDVLLVGTNDLAADLGIAGEFDHGLIATAYSRVIAACRATGKFAGVGGLAARPDLVARFVQMGARYVSTGNDLGFLLDALVNQASRARALLKP